MQRLSTCAYQYSHGCIFVRQRLQSSSIRLLDLHGNIPMFIHINYGRLLDVNILDSLVIEPGAFYIMDRGYLDFARLYMLHLSKVFFVTRGKSNSKSRRQHSHPVDRTTGPICDQSGTLTGVYSASHYPEKIRRIKYHDADLDKTLIFLTNNFTLPAMTIAQLYRCRWQVELFFKWIKQNLRIKSFYGTSDNAVKTQVWIAVSIYVVVAIIKERLKLQASLYAILQILSVTMFERTPLIQILTDTQISDNETLSENRLILFD